MTVNMLKLPRYAREGAHPPPAPTPYGCYAAVYGHTHFESNGLTTLNLLPTALLPEKRRGRPLLLGEQLDKQVRAYVTSDVT